VLDRYVIQDDLFTTLPIEMFIEIISYLDPIFIVNSISLINTFFHFYANTNEFWLKKLKLHFPHKLAEYEKKMKPLGQNFIDLDAYAEFIKSYKYDYLYLTPKIRAFFSIAKENNSVNWYDKGKLLLLENGLDKSDYSKHGLLFWIKNNKFVIDNLYQSKKKIYIDDNQKLDTKKIDQNDRTILYWAFVLDQDLKEIKSLLSLGSKLDEKCCTEWPIHIAAREGRLDLVKFIIGEQGNMLNLPGVCGHTPLMIAASQGYLAVVQYLLGQAGIDLNATSRLHRGMNALHCAAESGHTDIISALLKAGMDATLATSRENGLVYLPIHFAVKSGHLDAVIRLIKEQPQTIDALDCFGQTPFLWAVAMGYLAIVQYYINAYVYEKANINLNVATHRLHHDDHDKTLLHWAAQNGHYAIVLELLKVGVNIDTTNGKLLPIHLACKNGHLEIVIVLLKCKPELLNIPDNDGNTPLIHATKRGDRSLVKYLLSQNGIDIHVETHAYFNNRNQVVAFDFAIRSGNSKIVAAFLKAGVDINKHDGTANQQLPIHRAVHDNNLSIVKVLIEHQPDMLNRADRYGITSLMIAASQALAIVKYFLSMNETNKKALDLDVKTFGNSNCLKNDKTALHFAAESGNDDVVALLLKAGASHLPTSNGQFPIHFAAASDKSKVVKQLIDARPDMLNMTDNHGYTPLMIACGYGSYNTIITLFKNEERNNRVNIHAKTSGLDNPNDNGKTALHIAAEKGQGRIVNVLFSSGAGTSLDLTTPINKNRWFNRMSKHTKNKIKQIEAMNNKKAASQFNHAFNFYHTSFGDREAASQNHLAFGPAKEHSLKK
jgi:ankyrin repeat protein